MVNDEVSKAIGEKQRLYTVWRKDKTEENLVQYNIAKRLSKKAVLAVKEVEIKEFTKKLHTEDERGNVFRIAKQIANNNKDVVGCGGIKDTSRKIITDQERIKVVCSILSVILL